MNGEGIENPFRPRATRDYRARDCLAKLWRWDLSYHESAEVKGLRRLLSAVIDALGHHRHAGLEPLAYHVELRDYLKRHERELWRWFASAQTKADHTERLHGEQLKSTDQ
jgi:hypothetical protein